MTEAVEAAIKSEVLSSGRPLIIVGEEEGKAANLSAVSDAISDGRIQILTRVSNEQLSWLYRHARALISPSLDEGFGLPPIEALHFATPVIASDFPGLRENLGLHAA